MYINVNNIKLFYEKKGVGYPLIMVHGNGETHDIFDAASEQLKEYFTVYSLDSRGHGLSEQTKTYHYKDMAEDIYCFIQELKLEKPIFYGFSDGGIIGLLLEINHPDTLSKLIISGANTTPDGLNTGFRLLFKLIYLINKDAKFKMMLTEPNITSEMLNSITIPTYITAGQRDLIKFDDTKFIHNNITKSTLTVFKGETHSSYIVHSRKISDYIISALNIK